MQQLKNQPCPVCNANKLNLLEEEYNVPHFGKCYLMAMSCEACGYKVSDVESEEQKEPSRLTFEVKNKKDLNVRVIKSGHATVKIPTLRMSAEPGAASEGYISNVEGVIQRFKKIVEGERDSTDDDGVRKTAKNLLKKMWKVELGEVPIKIVIEDPSGNSAILSDKTVIEKLKVKK